MATKLTVALVGGIVIVVSIAILIIETLTSPSRCKPRGETSQTERTLLQKSEPVSSPSTILSPRTNFPPHSTNLPSLGDTFANNSTPQPSTAEEASISTTNVSGTRNIIIVPQRNCGNGEKRDKSGACRQKW
jgi:hypothetical protein